MPPKSNDLWVEGGDLELGLFKSTVVISAPVREREKEQPDADPRNRADGRAAQPQPPPATPPHLPLPPAANGLHTLQSGVRTETLDTNDLLKLIGIPGDKVKATAAFTILALFASTAALAGCFRPVMFTFGHGLGAFCGMVAMCVWLGFTVL